jgi:hypothetical protein
MDINITHRYTSEGFWRRKDCQFSILFPNGDLTLTLAGWRPLRAGAGRGGSGRAPGWCGCAVASLLLHGFGGPVCWRPAIGLPVRLSMLVRWGAAWGCGGGRAAAWASSGRGPL